MAKQGNLRENLLLGMGNPLLDISAIVEKNFLAKYEMNENDAILADEKHKNLYNELANNYHVDYTAGGSVQNALRVAQWHLGIPKVTTFLGCVGQDNFSKILYDKATSDGVNVRYQYNSQQPTGTCAVLITDHHRSLCANLASANYFTIDHIKDPENKKLIDAAQYYYISGFFLTVSVPSIMAVAELALANNKPFLMNLSAPFICQFYTECVTCVLPYVDIIFGNESEAQTFANSQNWGRKTPKEIALKLCQLPKRNTSRSRIAIITQGVDPVILAKDGQIIEFAVSQIPKEQIVDTNGAGDAFVGGFLAQYIQGRNLDICIKCAIWTAGKIIQRSGCTFDGKPNFRA